jgi:two-component system CheB/CheR fusion protein
VIDGVVITFTDSSERRAMEEALREQENQFRQLSEATPALVWGSKADGACDYLNDRWSEYTGIPDSEQLGYGWVEQVHPEDRERVRDAWRQSLKAGSVFEQEFRLRRSDNTYRWFKARSVPIRGWKGSIAKWYGVNIDVDDLKGRSSPSPAR